MFENDAKYSQRNVSNSEDLNKSEVTRLISAVRSNLIANNFKPELLGRFSRIIPYRGLSEAEYLAIAESKIDSLVRSFRDMRDIELVLNEPRQWPKDIYDYFTTDVALDITFVRAQIQTTESGGARKIQREIEDNLKDEIIDQIIENPTCRRFKIEVNRNSTIYDGSVDRSVKGVIVRALTN